MFAVEASTAPGVLETEIPEVSNETLRNLFGGQSLRHTFGGAGIGVDLVIPRAVMGYKPKALRKCIDQFLVKSPRQLLATHGVS